MVAMNRAVRRELSSEIPKIEAAALTRKSEPVQETPDTVHGRLLESVHFSGYGFERACAELKWLLEHDRWQLVAGGAYRGDLKAFLATIDLSEFRMVLEQRKEIVKLLKANGASGRATARVLGVDEITIRRDLAPATNVAPTQDTAQEPEQERTAAPALATNVAPWFQSPVAQIVMGPSDARPHVARNSGNNEWYTPADYIDAARQVLGGIDLDPASSTEANTVVQAHRYYTRADDGLTQAWHGRVWLNPPYARPLVDQFCAKLAASVTAGTVSAAIVLVNNATETEWFRTVSAVAAAVCFPQRRVHFVRPEGDAGGPLQGQAILYIGAEIGRFSAGFARFGDVWIRQTPGGIQMFPGGTLGKPAGSLARASPANDGFFEAESGS
jgi:phage N-6-adenine-methyltransferase